MAGKTKEMSQIKQLLLLSKQGVSNREIARTIGINKETVNNYVRKATGDELGIEGQHTVAGRTSPSTVLGDTYAGGEKLYLDFAGDTLGYTDPETGEQVRVQTFVACLPASDYGYALCVPSQKTEDFVHAIIECLKALGGAPRIWVPDNLKAAVVKTDRYEPTLNRMMEEMANLLGCDKHHYSVPHVHIGKDASVVFTRSIVKIYVGGGQALDELGRLISSIFHTSEMPAETH